MNVGVAYIITSDTVTPALKEWLHKLGPDELAGRVGPAVADLTRMHLGGMGPNVLGYRSTKFYDNFVENVRWLPLVDGVAVAILPAVINGRQVGLRQHVFGGTIKPLPGRKFLAIPISPVSYGHVPSDFPGLFLLRTVKGAYLAQRGEDISVKTGRVIGKRSLGGHAGRRLRAELNILFILKSSVTQEGKREALPSDEKYLNTALKAAAQLN